MRWLTTAILGMALAAGGCGGTAATAPTPAATLSGTWAGSAADSTGTMMGTGMSPSMMSNITWTLAQSGTAVTGVAQFAGYQGGRMNVSGTVMGKSATVTFTMAVGSMPMMGTQCTATATGTIDIDDMMSQIRGSYSGTNSCSGPFDHGQVSMMRVR